MRPFDSYGALLPFATRLRSFFRGRLTTPTILLPSPFCPDAGICVAASAKMTANATPEIAFDEIFFMVVPCFDLRIVSGRKLFPGWCDDNDNLGQVFSGRGRERDRDHDRGRGSRPEG